VLDWALRRRIGLEVDDVKAIGHSSNQIDIAGEEQSTLRGTSYWVLDLKGGANYSLEALSPQRVERAADVARGLLKVLAPFERLVAQVMRQEPYRSARRVFWVTDNGSSHRGDRAAARLQARWPTLVLVHTPVHTSWLNQVEIYFSVVQRKVLTPNDSVSLGAVKDRLLRFQARYTRVAKPFQWTFSRRDLTVLLA